MNPGEMINAYRYKMILDGNRLKRNFHKRSQFKEEKGIDRKDLS